MATVVITNPRVTATADLQIEGGPVLSITVPRDANQDTILAEIKTQVARESQRRSAVGQPALRQLTDDELVPALALFNQMAGSPRVIEPEPEPEPVPTQTE